MSVIKKSGRLLFLTAVVVLLALAVISVSSAEKDIKPPEWVGIYTTAGKVGLKWSPVSGAASYRIFKSIVSGKEYKPVAATSDVSFIDTDVRPGETYYYVLKSVTPDGVESQLSEERYIKLPPSGGGMPVAPPEWLGELIEAKRIRLAWVASPSSNALAYNIYKSLDMAAEFRLVGSTQDTTYMDTDVKPGETYYYALTTLDKDFKETEFSEIKQVVFALPEEAPEAVRRVGPRGEEEYAPPEKMIAKPTRVVGYITKGKDDLPLFSPTDIDIGPSGNIYVTDTGSSTIQVFRPDGEFVKALGGYGNEDGKFIKLLGLDVDEAGFVLATDAYTGKIQKFNPGGKLFMRKNMAEDGKAIARDLGRKEPVKEFGVVKTLAAPDGTIYLLDNYNDCVIVYSSNGNYIKAFGGLGLDDGKFQGPTFAAFGEDGNLYVVDCFNARVQVFNREGDFLWKFGSYGNVLGTFGRPKGICMDGDGRIYIADSLSNVVQVFDKDGVFLFLLGDERGRQMDLGTPNGIVIDKRRRIYMVEKLINRIQIRQVGE